jgi:hypothetical protein
MTFVVMNTGSALISPVLHQYSPVPHVMNGEQECTQCKVDDGCL